ncbi:hypothetical protein KY290_005254 [Solanum tuberosum]|uniref:PiggyBac transposable element-derived protein domain-containing protein n=1 Tax=Solanum tuberosum TaxID=4113 RepID=A0ABQ7WDK3_SOLTU|nr:hypothetical protein KY289_005648 [Solanum tuberosum]KAH0778827.1 hypothetical protein KY290_005254 [Solanum tuberosum]
MALPNDRLGDDILKARRHEVLCLPDTRTQPNQPPPPTASQSEGHDDSKASSFEVASLLITRGAMQSLKLALGMMLLFLHLQKYQRIIRELRQRHVQHGGKMRVMWTVNRSEDFFEKGIMSRSGGFRKRPLMPETRVVMADIQAFSDIYRLFQIHQFEWMTNTPGEYTSYLPREFYVVYAATLLNMVVETETTERA